ncbi:MAG: S46 family peptidase, partial [Chitinophagaceae bacterium]
IKDGEFSMIWGYPGSTNRYESSYGVQLSTEINNPTLVKLREIRLKYMMEEIKKDPANKLKLGPSYAVVANYWKFYDGETKQLLKYDVYGQKKKKEEIFTKWADGKPQYQGLFAEWGDAYTAWKKYAKHRVYINEGILGSPIFDFCAMLIPLEAALVRTGSTQADVKKAIESADSYRQKFLSGENKISDQNITAAILKSFYENVPKDQQPIGLFGSIKNQYGSLEDEATYKKLTADIFSKTFLFDDAKWKAFIEHPDANVLQGDPAFYYGTSFYKNYISKYAPYYQQFNAKNMEFGRLYVKGIMEMDPVKAKMMYPDATFTMRVSYGAVKSYRPRDAVFYDYFTTSKGILEKYIPGDYEFDLPARQIELLKKKDFGQYADPVKKDLVICFITTNDITGGNSGSPVINGNGELIGLSFDGNYEALSHKLSFDKDYNRTINVDIRYVLWCIDKLGGATNIIKELKLVK